MSPAAAGALATALGLALLLIGAARPAGAYVEADVPDGGTVRGRVRFAGAAPSRAEPLPVRRNTDVCGEHKPSEALVVGPDGGVPGTVVYVEGVTRGKRPAEFELDNARCLFVPHVSAVMAGARVRVRNSDPVLHNTHGYLDRLTVFNIALPNRDQVIDITRRIRKPGVVEVLCDAHTHMRAWIVVRDNPYFAVTDGAGQFRIPDVPPGRYRVAAWHEGWVVTGKDKDGRPLYDPPRVLTREVTVPARGEVAIEFQLE
jgi:plastocyanin